MENFYSLLCVMGMATWTPEAENSVDILKNLPTEIATLILRNLDGKSLFAACRVSRAWWRLCRSDGVLRRKIAFHLRQERRRREARMMGTDIVVLRDQQRVHADMFKPRNGKYAISRTNRDVYRPYVLETLTSSRPARHMKKAKKVQKAVTKLLRL